MKEKKKEEWGEEGVGGRLMYARIGARRSFIPLCYTCIMRILLFFFFELHMEISV